jgi:hypothetical protein
VERTAALTYHIVDIKLVQHLLLDKAEPAALST